MKIVSNIHVVDESFNVFDVIRRKPIADDENDEPFYICNISDVIRKDRIWKRSMPRVLPFYAVKCNDDPIVIQTLASLGTCFDCASKGEIQTALNNGATPESIIYANPTKSISHLKFAAKMNVDLMTVDSDFEMHKISTHFPNARLVLRIRYDDKSSLYPLGEKYGCNPDTEAPNLIELAKSLGLNMIGISFHVGSGGLNPIIFAKAIKVARKLFDFAESVGFHFTLLDIGGGFPGAKKTDIKEYASVVNHSIESHFPSQDVTIIAEPGRYYVESAFTLFCQVHSKREIRENGQFKSMMYFINDGVYGSLRDILFHEVAYPLTLKSVDEETFKSSVWGPTMDAIDKICEDVQLPQLNIDDFMIFEDKGAYTISLASRFNGLPLPKVEYYIENEHWQDLNSTSVRHENTLDH